MSLIHLLIILIDNIYKAGCGGELKIRHATEAYPYEISLSFSTQERQNQLHIYSWPRASYYVRMVSRGNQKPTVLV